MTPGFYVFLFSGVLIDKRRRGRMNHRSFFFNIWIVNLNINYDILSHFVMVATRGAPHANETRMLPLTITSTGELCLWYQLFLSLMHVTKVHCYKYNCKRKTSEHLSLGIPENEAAHELAVTYSGHDLWVFKSNINTKQNHA